MPDPKPNADGRALAVYEGHTGEVLGAPADGRTIAAGDEAGHVLFLRVNL